MDNVVTQIKTERNLTDREIAEHIKQATGHSYHPGHIMNVRLGYRAVSDKMKYRLLQTYPEYSAEITTR